MREAWIQTLRGECGYTEAEMKAAAARCDVTRRHLVAALLGRATDAAHPDLEDRLTSARIATHNHQQALAALAAELGRQESPGRLRDGHADRARRGRMARDPGEGVATPRPWARRPLPALGKLWRHFYIRLRGSPDRTAPE